MNEPRNPEAALENLMMRAAKINAAVAQLRGRGQAADGNIQVEVDADGLITDLHIAEALRGTAPSELADSIRRAQQLAIESTKHAVHQLQSEVTEDPHASSILRGITDARATSPRNAASQFDPMPAAEPTDWEDPNWPPKTWLV